MRDILVFSLLTSTLLVASDYNSDGKALGSYFNSNFQSAIVAPGTTATDFKTMDNKTSFRANLTCEGSTISVADISYAGTNDISITINLDTNSDGIKEKTSTLSGVSGICAEGVIKCDSGTWNNCSYYSYQYSSSGVALANSNKSNLSNCYCINSSCGSPSVRNKKSVLDDITAGVYGVLQANLPRLVLTRTTNDGATSQVYGERQDTCTNFKAGTKTYAYNETDGTGIVNQGQNMLATDQNNPDTAAGTLLKATSNENSMDFTADKNAMKNKVGTITPANGDSFDMSKIEGNPTTQYCQVQKLKPNAQVYTDSSTAYTSGTTNTDIYEYFLYECTGVNHDVCPFETGQTVKYPCGQVNQKSFNESVSGINALKSMADDMVCSSN